MIVAAWLGLTAAWAQTEGQGERKKVAVVLSGGGAKGMAHIGALKVIERAGLPIDIVTGTSMGSIVGGLYAIGYNAELLDSLVRRQNWTFVLSDRENLSLQNMKERQKQYTYIISKAQRLGQRDVEDGGLIKGKNLADLFGTLTSGYNDSIDFNTLPIPFACVATDIVENTEYVFHSGRLAQAMRASMAIPAAFAPVRMGKKVLVDGGLRNNYPADVARAMGADIIIGVTVQGPPRTADDLGSTGSILGQIVDVNCKNKYDENLSITDVPIRVNTKGYGSASFTASAIDTLIRRGEEEAMKHWDELMALKKRIGVSDDYRHPLLTPVGGTSTNERMRIAALQFEGMTPSDEQFIRRKFHLNVGDSIDYEQAELVTTAMRVDLFYKDASSRFYRQGEEGTRVVFSAGQKKTAQVNLGVRFDTEEMVALQLNGDIPLRSNIPTDVDLTLRLGKRIMAKVDLALHPRTFSKPSLSYIYRHNEINIYEKGEKDYSITYNQHAAELSLLNFYVRNLNVTGGARWDYFDFLKLLVDHEMELDEEKLKNGHYFSYFARMYYSSENDWFLPTRGARFKAQYAYYTDDLARLNGHAGMSEVSASWRMSFALTQRFTLQPMVYGRMLFGSDHPHALNNMVGGQWFGHYFEQQVPFPGMGHVQRALPHFLAVQLKMQQRIATNNYVTLRVAAAQNASKMKELFDYSTMIGTSLTYYYNTLFGPLGATLGWCNKTKELNFYINLGFEF